MNTYECFKVGDYNARLILKTEKEYKPGDIYTSEYRDENHHFIYGRYVIMENIDVSILFPSSGRQIHDLRRVSAEKPDFENMEKFEMGRTKLIEKMRKDGYPYKIKGNGGFSAVLYGIQPLSGGTIWLYTVIPAEHVAIA